MARLLAPRDSTNIHLNLGRRHYRLCVRYRQDTMAASIKAAIDNLVQKALAAEDRDLDRQAAADAIVASDADLDDAVRNLFDSARIAERTDPSSRPLDTLFPEGRFTTITDADAFDEPALVEAVITRLSKLGDTHMLAPHVALLRAAVGDLKGSIKAHDDAMAAMKAADAEEALSADSLRRQYESNYFDARKKLSRPMAERLFVSGRNPTSPATPPAAERPPAPAPAGS
jgi:hypothetical protein